MHESAGKNSIQGLTLKPHQYNREDQYQNQAEFNSKIEDLSSFANFIQSISDLDHLDDPLLVFQPSMEESCEMGVPYLPAKRSPHAFTLVLDLDETLVHFEDDGNGGGKFLTRPYSIQFLQELSRHFEIVIFTAAMQDYADFILDKLDKGRRISHRLYRDHTTVHQNVYQKDLSKLGRCLSKTIIVDNNALNFRLQPANGIYIKSWYSDPQDEALIKLCPLLIQIAKSGYPDVRVALKNIKTRVGAVSSPNTNDFKHVNQ